MLNTVFLVYAWHMGHQDEQSRDVAQKKLFFIKKKWDLVIPVAPIG